MKESQKKCAQIQSLAQDLPEINKLQIRLLLLEFEVAVMNETYEALKIARQPQ